MSGILTHRVRCPSNKSAQSTVYIPDSAQLSFLRFPRNSSRRAKLLFASPRGELPPHFALRPHACSRLWGCPLRAHGSAAYQRRPAVHSSHFVPSSPPSSPEDDFSADQALHFAPLYALARVSSGPGPPPVRRHSAVCASEPRQLLRRDALSPPGTLAALRAQSPATGAPRRRPWPAPPQRRLPRPGSGSR